MSGIRVTYSGLVSFGINLITIVTGLIFTLIVTRNLSIEEFGTWGLINGIIIYATIISPIITYWITREVARGEKSSKTAIYSSSGLSLIGISVYLAIAYIVGSQSDADLGILLFAAILIPIMFIEHVLTSINLGDKPHVTSYGVLAFEITKIPFGLIFVYFLQTGVEGAILASFLSYVSRSTVLAYFAKEHLKTQFQKEYLKKWLKLFWLPTYRTLPAMLSLSDVAIFSILTGSVVGVAYYSSAKTIGYLVNHVRGFSKGVYPKLLQSEKQEFLQDNLIILFYISIPLIAFSITFAKPGLFALNPIYQIAAPLVIFISLRTFLTTLNNALFQALLGMEGIDKNIKSTSFKEYLKSKLVWYPTLQLIRYGIFLSSLAIILYIFSSQVDSTIDLVLYWVIISLIVEIPLTLYIIQLVKKTFTLNIDKLSIMKYLVASVIVFSLIGFIMENNLEYKNNIFEFLPQIIGFAIISVVSYIIVTYLIDKRTKKLVNAICKEVIKKGRR